jgi:hypothetical protein
MRSKLFFQLSLTVILILSSIHPAFSQTVPSAYEGSLPFTAGAGASNFNVDWGKTRMYGVTLWGDWHPGTLPNFLRGLGVEMEARDISFDRNKDVTPNFRMDTFGGGLIYTWHHFRYIRPYGKGLISLGSFDFNDKKTSNFNHNTELEFSPGLGLEFRTLPHFWVRADYEYQIWQPIFGKTPDPQGFTLGAVYDFGTFHRRL